MKIVFRCDASVHVGTGHVMRCLTLAEELSKRGVEISFLCSDCEGSMCYFIENKGYFVARLPVMESRTSMVNFTGINWEEDAKNTCDVLREKSWDWLVVDHYGIDQKWESYVRKHIDYIMVIDDLANRNHDADLLLDQNYKNNLHKLYPSLLPESAILITGSAYALVRSKFGELRKESLTRRKGTVNRLLVFMGGGDPDNDTAKVLIGLKSSVLKGITVDVVLGGSNPHYNEIKEICSRLPAAILHVQTPHMAQLMTSADCAINAAGSTTWERCTLGLPGLVVIQSDDQVAIATEVDSMGGHKLLGRASDLTSADYAIAIESLKGFDLNQMSEISSSLCDGKGASRVADQLYDFLG